MADDRTHPRFLRGPAAIAAKDLKPLFDGGEPMKILRDDLDKILTWAAQNKVSDIVLQAGEPIVAVHQDDVLRVGNRMLTSDEIQDLLAMIVSPEAPAQLKGSNDIPFRHQVAVDRGLRYQFRGQATGIQSPNGLGSAIELDFRTIAAVPPSYNDIRLPFEIVEAFLPKSGLGLVTGPTGSGKSTTLAAIIRYFLETEPRRVITHEHPIEFDFYAIPNRWGTVAQSQIGDHLKDWKHAVKIMLRRKPSRILFGEIRDRETIEGSFVAAQTGHSVLGTLHTNSVPSAIPRLVNEFPEAARWSMARNLIESMNVILHQRLIKSLDGGLVALHEWLSFNEEDRDRVLAAGETGYVAEIANMLRERGTRLVDSAERAFSEGLIGERDVAIARGDYRASLKALVAETGTKAPIRISDEGSAPAHEPVPLPAEIGALDDEGDA